MEIVINGRFSDSERYGGPTVRARSSSGNRCDTRYAAQHKSDGHIAAPVTAASAMEKHHTMPSGIPARSCMGAIGTAMAVPWPSFVLPGQFGPYFISPKFTASRCHSARSLLPIFSQRLQPRFPILVRNCHTAGIRSCHSRHHRLGIRARCHKRILSRRSAATSCYSERRLTIRVRIHFLPMERNQIKAMFYMSAR